MNATQELSCRELYDKWIDPEFPGGRPPPLGPTEEINDELCRYLRQQAGRLPTMASRRKRHRNSDKFTDDEEMISDDPAKLIKEEVSDLGFDDSDDKKETFIVEFNKEPVAASAALIMDKSSGKSSSIRSLTSSPLIFTNFAAILYSYM